MIPPCRRCQMWLLSPTSPEEYLSFLWPDYGVLYEGVTVMLNVRNYTRSIVSKSLGWSHGLCHVCSFAFAFHRSVFNQSLILFTLCFLITWYMTNIHIYKYILLDLSGASCRDTILCIEVFAIQCNSKRSRNSVWFIKQWFVLIFVSLCACVCFERNPVLFSVWFRVYNTLRTLWLTHSKALIRFSRFLRRHG